MMNDYLKVLIGVIVAGLLVMVMAVPIVSSMTETTRIYHNEGVPFALATNEDLVSHEIVIDNTGLTSDGITIDATAYLPGDYTIVFGEHSIFRYTPANGRVVFGGTVFEGSSGQFTDIRTANSEETLTITIVGDTLTTVNGETTYTVEDTWAYVSDKGTYRYCVNPCVTADSRIIGGGVTYSPFSSATVICFDGTVENIDAGIYRASPAATLNNVVVNTSVVATNLLKIDSIVFNATQSDTDKTATYTYFLAPYEIVYENPAYVGGILSLIYDLLPLLAGIGVLTVAVVYFINRR